MESQKTWFEGRTLDEKLYDFVLEDMRKKNRGTFWFGMTMLNIFAQAPNSTLGLRSFALLPITLGTIFIISARLDLSKIRSNRFQWNKGVVSDIHYKQSSGHHKSNFSWVYVNDLRCDYLQKLNNFKVGDNVIVLNLGDEHYMCSKMS